MDPHNANIWIHIGAGVVALSVGALALLTHKGGSIHRRVGRAFVAMGAVVFLSALIGIVFFDAPAPLVAAALSGGYQYVSSVRALQLSERGPQPLDALLAVAGLAGAASLFVLMGPGTASWSPAIGYSAIGYVVIIAVYDLSRHAWPRTWLQKARPLDHGLKMTGAYFAMMSAGVGNAFRDWQPWSQVLPSVVGVFVILLLFVRHSMRRKPVPAAVQRV